MALKSLIDHFLNTCRSHPQETALVHGLDALTYFELWEKSVNLTDQVTGLGLNFDPHPIYLDLLEESAKILSFLLRTALIWSEGSRTLQRGGKGTIL